ncbi:MAG TPA: ABC transporter permease, partial [Blastocatellia bacterium]|nr:ABC transporter permease [Blastocatellia bacterium]
VVGKSITLNSESYQIVGVMPAGFELPLNEDTEIWAPLIFSSNELTLRNSHYLKVLGRLKPGVSINQARAEIESIAGQLQQEYPKANADIGASVFPLHAEVVGGVRDAMLIFFGAVSFLLLIACANVANLLLARAATRHKEIAIRAALGASRWRLMRQMLTESVLQSVVGGAAGLLLAMWGIELFASLLNETRVPRAQSIGLDLRVLVFTFLVSLVTGIVFGLAPAFQASRPDLNEALKKGGQRGSAGSLRGSRLRSGLVIAEVALALVLLVGSGLLINSFFRLRAVDSGVIAENVLTMRINLPAQKYPRSDQVTQFHQQVVEQVTSLPGVAAAGTVTFLPYGGSNGAFGYTIDSPLADKPVSITSQLVSSDYFRAMGIPLNKGRAFDERDLENARRVTIISDALARRYWPDQVPMGQRIKWGDRTSETSWMTVVGVVGDVRTGQLNTEAKPALYIPYVQLGDPVKTGVGVTVKELVTSDARTINLVIRTVSNPELLADQVRAAVWSVDKDQPVTNVKTMEQVLADTMIVPRFSTWLLAIFASVALILAAAGIYGVISYSVSQRTHEIGIRIALGALHKDVLKLVVGQGMLPALIGLMVGLVGAFALTRLMSNLLFEVSATDPLTFAILSLVLAGVALGACFVPARRATKVDPIVALRCE